MTLQRHDLRDLIYHIFEIDGYKSKMGSDEDIITVSFSAKTEESAKDLSDFFERGYSFVLDSDYTKGEQSDGTYKIFVEIQRENDAIEHISDLVNGVENLTDLENIRFRYYKNWRSKEFNVQNLKEMLPLDPENYGRIQNESNMENYKNFFNKSFVESVDMWDDIIRIKKAYAEPVYFRFLDFGNKTETINNITESFNINSYSETLFLTKYIGNYAITKYGEKIVMENNNKALVLERIQT